MPITCIVNFSQLAFGWVQARCRRSLVRKVTDAQGAEAYPPVARTRVKRFQKTRAGKRFYRRFIAIAVLSALPLTDALPSVPTPQSRRRLITRTRLTHTNSAGRKIMREATACDSSRPPNARDMYVWRRRVPGFKNRCTGINSPAAMTEMQKTEVSSDVTYATVMDSARCKLYFRLCQWAAVLRRQSRFQRWLALVR